MDSPKWRKLQGYPAKLLAGVPLSQDKAMDHSAPKPTAGQPQPRAIYFLGVHSIWALPQTAPPCSITSYDRPTHYCIRQYERIISSGRSAYPVDPYSLLNVCSSHLVSQICFSIHLDCKSDRIAIKTYAYLPSVVNPQLPLVRNRWSIDNHQYAWNPAYEGYSSWE